MDQKTPVDGNLTSDDRFRLLVDAVTDYAIYILTPDGIVASWNAGAERFKGYAASEIVGQHFSRFYTEEDRESGLPGRALQIAAEEGKFESEGWRVRKDGNRFWASVVIDPIRKVSGELLGFAKITRDLTERRQTQRDLEKAREAFFQSQKLEAIGQLTGGVAHDFNNLLMAILGSLELVRRRLPEDPKITPLLDNAIQGAQRGASLTKRLLAFARRQELKLEAVDIPTLVRGMTELLERSLGPSVTIESRFPVAIKAVRADSNQLEMALLNLAVNARDAMPAGGHIVISAREESIPIGHMSNVTPGHYVCLSVIDRGEGMDEETLSRATEPFFTTKGPGKGTGLGLSVVHGVTAQSGGHLVLKSQRGVGTTAELWLPLAQEDAKGVEGYLPPSTDEKKRRSLVVLAVDDDALVLLNTVAMLEELGHTALEALSAKQALDILRRNKAVDLVITDQAMPRMTGVQLAEAIKGEWPDLPIIVATGYAELPPGLGANLPKLAKPFQQGDLARAIAATIHA